MTKHWIALILGFWVLISPWVLGASDITLIKWSNVVAGIIITLLSVWFIFGYDLDQIIGDEIESDGKKLEK
jgi:hypothetical protein